MVLVWLEQGRERIDFASDDSRDNLLPEVAFPLALRSNFRQQSGFHVNYATHVAT